MDNTERRELSRSLKSIRDSMPRNYVERGVSRRDTARRGAEDAYEAYRPKAVSEYRSERLRYEEQEREAAVAAAARKDEPFHPNGATYGSDGREHSAAARRFQRRSSARPARQLAPDEEP